MQLKLYVRGTALQSLTIPWNRRFFENSTRNNKNNNNNNKRVCDSYLSRNYICQRVHTASQLFQSFVYTESSYSSFTTRTISKSKGISTTPLVSTSASHLLNGLTVYEVMADDGHPLAVYSVDWKNENITSSTFAAQRRPILLLHGRTWSSVPVYHLLGGDNKERYKQSHSRSLLESLYNAGLQPYAMDFRGFGGTPSDSTGVVIPHRCVKDVECVLQFLAKKNGIPSLETCGIDGDQDTHHTPSNLDPSVMMTRHDEHHLPALLGWSQGALIAQMTAQKSPHLMSKLILYGSIYDPLYRYPRTPLYQEDDHTDPEGGGSDPVLLRKKNTFNAAIEDFTVEGSIGSEPARLFAQTALMTDPWKAKWSQQCQFNNLDPARVHVPTLVVAGDQDPYAPLRVQAELFTNLGRGVDRTWSIIADADHAVHLLDGGRERFVAIVQSFVENGKKGENTC